MNSFDLARGDLKAALAKAGEEGIEPGQYGQAMMWQLLQLYRSLGRSEEDIRSEISFALDNIDEDNTFHVVRN